MISESKTATHSAPSALPAAIKITHELIDKITSRQSIYVIDDLITHIRSTLRREVNLHVVFFQRKLFQTNAASDTQDESSDYLFLPFISFSIDCGFVKRYKNFSDVMELYKTFRRRRQSYSVKRHNVALYAFGTKINKKEKELLKLFCEACYVYYATSDVFQHLLSRSSLRFTKEFAKKYENTYEPVNICKDISEHFCVSGFYVSLVGDNKYHIHSDDQDKHSFLFNCELFYHDLSESTKRRLQYSGRVSDRDGDIYYKILPAIDRFSQDILVPGAFIIYRRTINLPTQCEVVARQLIDTMVYQRYSLARTRFIESLQSQMISRSLKRSLKSARTISARKQILLEFSEACVKGLCQYSFAHSATIRLFSPFAEALIPLCYFNTEHGKYIAGKANYIPTSNWKTSVNAFCFRGASSDDFIYIPDVSQIPESIRDKGLEAIAHVRENTRSEICFPLYSEDICLGTLNIEAPVPHAFDAEISFFRSVIGLFNQFFRLISQISDSEWLSRLSFTHFATHRLENFERSLDDTQKFELRQILERLNSAYSSAQLSNNSGTAKTKCFLRNILSYARGLQKSDEKVDIIRVTGDVPDRLPLPFERSFEVILKSLIDNAKRHSKLEEDNLEIRFSSKHFDGAVSAKHPYVEVHYRASRGSIEEHEIESFTVSPIPDPDGETIHLGLFLIGVHTRLLGGVIDIKRPCEGESATMLEMSVRLPLTESKSVG